MSALPTLDFNFGLSFNGAIINEQIEGIATFDFSADEPLMSVLLGGVFGDPSAVVSAKTTDPLGIAMWRAAQVEIETNYQTEVDDLRAQWFHNPDRPRQSYADEHRLRVREVV